LLHKEVKAIRWNYSGQRSSCSPLPGNRI